MKTVREFSNRRLLILTIALYLFLWLAEVVSKIMAVFGQFSNHKVTSSLANKAGQGLRLLAFQIAAYIVTLILVHVLFAVLNTHYTILMKGWLRRRWPKFSQHALWFAFLIVNGSFLAGAYGLNAALYPASDQAFLRAALNLIGNAAALKTLAIVILAGYLLGFVLLNFRYARKAAMVTSLIVWAGLLVASLDPVYIARKTFPPKGLSENTGPNVIVIGLDSLNPLHTGYFGYPLSLTPHLDSFLRENIVFENCYTPIARTFPAWYTILTGQYPITNGVRLNLMKRKYIKSSDQCLGHVLNGEGYATAFITDEVRFSNITAEEGFDFLRHPPMGIRDFFFGTFHDFSLTNVFFNNPLGYRLFPFMDINRAVAHLYDGRYFVNEVVTALDRLRNEDRIFLVAHLCVAHWPYIHACPREVSHRPGADPLMALYDSAVSRVDEHLGRIIDALKAKDLYENSIIVVLSDHGESAEGHGSDLRDPEQNRTLLALKPAGAPLHRSIGRLVRTIDIAPTILDLLGQEIATRPFDGMSLSPWTKGTEIPAHADSESVFLETEFSLDTPGGIGLELQSMIEQGIKFYEFDRTGLITVRDDYHDVLIRRRHRAIMTPNWKLIREVIVRGGVESIRTSLFDVRNDPHCRKDISAEQPVVFQELWDRLRRYYGSELTSQSHSLPKPPERQH